MAGYAALQPSVPVLKWVLNFCGGGVPIFEPKMRLTFGKLDKSIQLLRATYKAHSEWFEVPQPKSTKGKNEVDYSA
jgi:hypothetical protein